MEEICNSPMPMSCSIRIFLCLLEERGYILDLKVHGTNLYRQLEDLDGFEEWLITPAIK